MAVEDHPARPLVLAEQRELKYAAGGYNPPIVVIHGNLAGKITANSLYKRYLMNYFRKSLSKWGRRFAFSLKGGQMRTSVTH